MQNELFRIEVVGSAACLLQYSIPGTRRVFRLQPPVFEIDGQPRAARLRGLREAEPCRLLPHGVTEHVWTGEFRDLPGLHLDIVLRLAPDSPVIRFHYRLRADRVFRLTRSQGRDALTYLGLGLGAAPCKEVRFSEFDESVHSFRLTENAVPDAAFADRLALFGPMLTWSAGATSALVAYEHGSQVPDAFLEFRLAPARGVALNAVKGNYLAGQEVGPDSAFETIWFQFAAVAGDEAALAAEYRRFVLEYQSPNRASRRPYIFYNTWCYQERNKWWNGQAYLSSMNQERMLAEVDVAHRMGIDVFVLDTGWYGKTGDWEVNRRFFPDGLQALRERLEAYGMKLGLWFSPTQAAVTSRIMQRLPECRMTRDGTLQGPYEVWETEASYNFCLASPYWEAFADELIRLTREVGVTYFKWDAVGQHGCNDPGHWHGDASHTPQERADRYAFELGRYMARVVDKLCAACPEAIVDFDITEGGRYVGLGFLAAGKYFLINNGPYFPTLDQPFDWATATVWSNVFVYPGPARARVCRTPLDYDKWLPSVLFLTHYLPDDPDTSQLLNIASLVLGQNGIWGDLLTVSPEGVARFGHWLGLYKQVRDDLTASSPVRLGITGGSPEVHEKILARTGRGAVAVFAAAAGRYQYVTRSRVDRAVVATPGVEVSFDDAGRAVLTLEFGQPGAHLVFFGVTG